MREPPPAPTGEPSTVADTLRMVNLAKQRPATATATAAGSTTDRGPLRPRPPTAKAPATFRSSDGSERPRSARVHALKQAPKPPPLPAADAPSPSPDAGSTAGEAPQPPPEGAETAREGRAARPPTSRRRRPPSAGFGNSVPRFEYQRDSRNVYPFRSSEGSTLLPPVPLGPGVNGAHAAREGGRRAAASPVAGVGAKAVPEEEPVYRLSLACGHANVHVMALQGLYDCTTCQEALCDLVRADLSPFALKARKEAPPPPRVTTAIEHTVRRVAELADGAYVFEPTAAEVAAEEAEEGGKAAGPAAGPKGKATAYSGPSGAVEAARERMESLEMGIEAQLEDFERMVERRTEIVERVDELFTVFGEEAAKAVQREREEGRRRPKMVNAEAMTDWLDAALQAAMLGITGIGPQPGDGGFGLPDAAPAEELSAAEAFLKGFGAASGPQAAGASPRRPGPAGEAAAAQFRNQRARLLANLKRRHYVGVPEPIADRFEELPPDYEPRKRPLAYCLKAVREIYLTKLEADDFETQNNGRRSPLHKFVIEMYVHKLGTRRLAESALVDLFTSCHELRDEHPAILLFLRFCGAFRALSDDHLEFYLKSLRQLALHSPPSIFRVNEDGTALVATSRALETVVFALRSAQHDEFGVPNLAEKLASAARSLGEDEDTGAVFRVKQLAYSTYRRAARSRTTTIEMATHIDADAFLDILLEEHAQGNKRLAAYLQELMASGDTNADGRLTFSEFSALMKSTFPQFADGQVLSMYREALGEGRDDVDRILLEYYAAREAVKLNPKKLAVVVEASLKEAAAKRHEEALRTGSGPGWGARTAPVPSAAPVYSSGWGRATT